MRTLSDREKRTLRFASIGIGIYLLAFCGFKMWQFLEARRTEYLRVVRQAQELKKSLEPYQLKVEAIRNLMEGFHMDPAKLNKATVVGEASAAIQKAAASSGIQIGPVRESTAARASSAERSLKLEGTGPVLAVLGWLNRMESIGYPVIIDEIQVTAEPSRPGMLKISFIVTVLDFEQWKTEAKPNA